MRQTRLYMPSEFTVGETIELDERTQHHCGTVLRAKVGDTIYLFNGEDGIDYQANLVSVSKKRVEAEIIATDEKQSESPLAIHLGQCISVSQRFDFAVQKATEMGVSEITPLISDRAQKLNSKQYEKKVHHWQQIAIHACEQSHRARIPTINLPMTLSEWLQSQKDSDMKWLCSIAKTGLPTDKADVKSLSLLIGPEGGLSSEEEAGALEEGFKALQLGQRVLRTETAPIAAITLAQLTWGDFK